MATTKTPQVSKAEIHQEIRSAMDWLLHIGQDLTQATRDWIESKIAEDGETDASRANDRRFEIHLRAAIAKGAPNAN